MKWRIREQSPGEFIVERRGGLWWVNACMHSFYGFGLVWPSLELAQGQMKRQIDLHLHQSRVIEEHITR